MVNFKKKFEKNMVNFFLIFEAGGQYGQFLKKFRKKYGQFFFNF